MEPKKKSKMVYIVIGIITIICLYLSLPLSIVYEKQYVKGLDYESGKKIGTMVKNDGSNGKKKGKHYEPPKLNVIDLFRVTYNNLKDYPMKMGFVSKDIRYSLQFAGGTLFIGLLMMGYVATNQKKYISGKEHGTAEWGTGKELLKFRAKTIREKKIEQIKKDRSLSHSQKQEKIEDVKNLIRDDSEVILSQTERMSYFQMEGCNNNIMIVGGSGSGKSRGFVMPNLLQAHDGPGTSSFVITDPKGELLAKSGTYLESQGYRVRAINFFEMGKSSCYNCFEYIHNDRESYEADVQALIDCIIVNTNGGKEDSGGDKFWDNSEKLFTASLFYAVSTAFTKEDRNINTVMELISWLEIEEEEDNRDSKLDFFFQDFAENFGQNHIAVRMFNEFRGKCAGKTAKSIVVTVVSRYQKFYADTVRRIVEKDELHLDQIGTEKTALFVIMPPTDKSYNFLAGMVFTQLLQELNYKANAEYGGRLPYHVKLILDEFANTCTIGGFTQLISYVRSLNISVVPILQSLSQLDTMYDEKQAKTIINNCSTFIYLGGVRTSDTLDEIVKWLGEGTYDSKEVSTGKGKGSTTVSYRKISRKLMDAAELQKMSPKKCLVLISGEKPMFSDKFDYSKHKNYKYTSDGNKKNTYVYDPKRISEQECGAQADINEMEDIYEETWQDEISQENYLEQTAEKWNEEAFDIDMDPDKVAEILEDIAIGLVLVDPVEAE